MSWKKTAVAGVATLALLGTLSACAPGGSAAVSTDRTVSTDVDGEEVTLKIVTTPEGGAPLDATIAAFEKKHPNITVEYEPTSFDAFVKQLPLQLASDSSPDIALINIVGTLAKDGLLLNLNDYSDAYGWADVYSAGQLGDFSLTDNLLGAGGTNLVALPSAFLHVGMFYNKEQAAAAGMTTPPKTLAEFETQLEAAKQAGLLPIQFGNAQGHAGFTIQEIGQSIDGAETARDWQWGQPGSEFDTKGNRTGVQKLVDWRDAGYFPPVTEINGTDLQGAVTKFTEGKGVFFLDGNWDAAKIEDVMGDNVGFFTFPGDKLTAAGGAASWAISAKSKHPDAAAAFLDFLHSPESSQAIFETGFLPQNVDSLDPDPGLISDIVKSFGEVSAADGVVGAYANATASMNDTLIQETQKLLAGSTTVDALITTVQTDWAGTHGK
jgi:ABC-type glycerol-3-phosphate transport system substrate-binding protein